MKKFSTAAVLAALAFSPALMAQDAVTGKWAVSLTTPQGAMELNFNLQADKTGALTGTVGSQMGDAPISDGKVKGKDVSFKQKVQMQGPGGPGGEMTISYTGKLEGDTLTLNMAMEGMPAGGAGMPAMPPMVAKRAK